MRRPARVAANHNPRKHPILLRDVPSQPHPSSQKLQLLRKKQSPLVHPQPVHLSPLVLEDVRQILRKAKLQERPVVKRQLPIRLLPRRHLRRNPHLLDRDQVVVLQLRVRPPKQIRLQARVLEAANQPIHPQRMALPTPSSTPIQNLPRPYRMQNRLLLIWTVVQRPRRHPCLQASHQSPQHAPQLTRPEQR